jgi:hypothetical protein
MAMNAFLLLNHPDEEVIDITTSHFRLFILKVYTKLTLGSEPPIVTCRIFLSLLTSGLVLMGVPAAPGV